MGKARDREVIGGVRVIAELGRAAAKTDNKEAADRFERLRLHVREGLKLNGNVVARAMVDQTMEGDLSALKLLVRMLDDPGGVPKKRVRRRSLAQRWAAEPEWQGEMEEDIWMDDGER